MDSGRRTEIEAQPLHRIARVPIRVTARRARWLLAFTLIVDLILIALYLASTLPEVRQLAPAARLTSLDLTALANLPWSWNVLKLYGIALTCALMAFSYSGGQRPDGFWRIGATIGFIMGVAESARLHEMWASGLAPALFGPDGDGETYALISRGVLLTIFYVAALSLFPNRSRAAFVVLVLSLLAIALAEMGPPTVLVSNLPSMIASKTVIVAWASGFHMASNTLILGALWFGMRDIQAVSVRYVYRG